MIAGVDAVRASIVSVNGIDVNQKYDQGEQNAIDDEVEKQRK